MFFKKVTLLVFPDTFTISIIWSKRVLQGFHGKLDTAQIGQL